MVERTRQFVFVSVGLVVCGVAVFFFYHEKVTAGVFMAFLAMLLLVLAHPDIIRFKAGREGIELERKLKHVEVALADVQALAAALARAVITAAEAGGRLGGMPDAQKKEILSDVIGVLKRIDLPQELVDRALADMHRYVAFDYAHYILGGSVIPESDDNKLHSEWRNLRGGGIDQIPTPDEIEGFLTRWNLLTVERQEQLADYRHYLSHHEHRHPDSWASREEWGRL